VRVAMGDTVERRAAIAAVLRERGADGGSAGAICVAFGAAGYDATEWEGALRGMDPTTFAELVAAVEAEACGGGGGGAAEPTLPELAALDDAPAIDLLGFGSSSSTPGGGGGAPLPAEPSSAPPPSTERWDHFGTLGLAGGGGRSGDLLGLGVPAYGGGSAAGAAAAGGGVDGAMMMGGGGDDLLGLCMGTPPPPTAGLPLPMEPQQPLAPPLAPAPAAAPSSSGAGIPGAGAAAPGGGGGGGEGGEDAPEGVFTLVCFPSELVGPKPVSTAAAATPLSCPPLTQTQRKPLAPPRRRLSAAPRPVLILITVMAVLPLPARPPARPPAAPHLHQGGGGHLRGPAHEPAAAARAAGRR
jgi:hypothetical protein